MVLLGGADQEGEAAGRGDQGSGSGQDLVEAFDGAESHGVEFGSKGFGAGVLYIDVRQCKCARDFAEEGCFLVVGFDQGERDLWLPEFDGKAGEPWAGAYVGDTNTNTNTNTNSNSNTNSFHHRGHRGHGGRSGEQVAGGEKALAEMADDDLFGVADGGEVDAGIPAEE